MTFEKIKAEEFNLSPVKEIGENWAILTGCRPDGSFNSMTVSWGAVGVLWSKPCVFVFVRPQRYTHEFLENGEYFSLSLLPEGFHRKVEVFGSRSGKDTDKYAVSGLTAAKENGITYCAEAKKVIFCRKIAQSDITREWFLDREDDAELYPDGGGRHTVYIGEITAVLEKR